MSGVDAVAAALEVPEILEGVEERCASAAGREALPRRPAESREQAADELDRIWAARRAVSWHGSFRFACEVPASALTSAGTPGVVLASEVLLAVWDGACCAVDAKKQARGERTGWERFGAEVDAVPDLPAYRDRCARVFDRRGGIKDHASPALASIRANKKRLEAQVQEELERILRSDRRRFLSEGFVTQKEGRWVVPLAADFKGRIPGVVVGASATGATLYVEPMRVLELSNDLRHASAAEAQEERRILEELTGLLGQVRGEAQAMVEMLAGLDALHARAAYAEARDCVAPELGAGTRILLRSGRHPLLGDACVPIDLELPEGGRALVLSGANAGGKTVALKTLGSLTFLACCGYHVPVGEGTLLPFPRRFECVIGDEQSIAHNLSSFSSHARHVGSILQRAGRGDMVLLDELMSGTDPEEGAAIAVEVLAELARLGALTVVTTHYSAIKLMAGEYEGFENASVEFDVKALEPTFRIMLGTAGPSRGFEIAVRFGVPALLVERARVRLGPERARMQSLLQEIETDRIDTALAREEAERLRLELEASRAEVDELRRRFSADARRDAEERAARFQEEQTELRQRVLAAIEGGRLKEAARQVEEAAADQEELPDAPPTEGWEEIRVGDRVRVAGWGMVGRVVGVRRSRKKATVDTGTVTLEADLCKLERLAEQGKETRAPAPVPGGGAAAPTKECMLVGLRAEEAREFLETELDRALAEGAAALRVIHGFGTGALRAVVDDVLRRHRHVARARPGGEGEGGRGATIVVFA